MTRVIIAVAVAIAILGGGWYWWQQQQTRLPDYIAYGNGRTEAEEVQVATKNPGRLAAVLVEEGDLVQAGQVLARMDTAETEASLAKAEAETRRAQEEVAEARAQVAQRDSELLFAQQELDRAAFLVRKGHTSEQRLNQTEMARDTARAALASSRARLATAERNVEVARAEADRIRVQIDDAMLRAPRLGRVQYRLAQPGEVLAAGGRVVTLLDLSDVFMVIFLPTPQAGKIEIGSEARLILDAYPEYVIPARITFVAAAAQFTPREVETRSEREKLMFRIKVKVPPELLLAYIDKVKTGMPGEAYVRTSDGPWPGRLTINLPPKPATGG